MRRRANAAVFRLTYPERYAIFICMKLIAIPFFVFKTLVLKPLDYLFYGGSGVLWRSRDEWRKMIRDAMPPAGSAVLSPVYSSRYTDDFSSFTPGANLAVKATGQPADDYYLTDFPPFPEDQSCRNW